jgi:hypothetical protein
VIAVVGKRLTVALRGGFAGMAEFTLQTAGLFSVRKYSFLKSRFTAVANMKSSGLQRTSERFAFTNKDSSQGNALPFTQIALTYGCLPNHSYAIAGDFHPGVCANSVTTGTTAPRLFRL